MIFQNSDVAHLRQQAAFYGHESVATLLSLLGVPFEDTYKILFGREPDWGREQYWKYR